MRKTINFKCFPGESFPVVSLRWLHNSQTLQFLTTMLKNSLFEKLLLSSLKMRYYDWCYFPLCWQYRWRLPIAGNLIEKLHVISKWETAVPCGVARTWLNKGGKMKQFLVNYEREKREVFLIITTFLHSGHDCMRRFQWGSKFSLPFMIQQWQQSFRKLSSLLL